MTRHLLALALACIFVVAGRRRREALVGAW